MCGLILFISCKKEATSFTVAKLKPFPVTITVTGNKMIDEKGTEVILHGLCAMDPLYQSYVTTPKSPSFDTHVIRWDEKYYQTMAEWGATVVRLPISPKYVRQFGYQKTLKILDQSINWITQNRMYVMIDYDTVSYPPTHESSTANEKLHYATNTEYHRFWKTIAKHYRNNPYIPFYELIDEVMFPTFTTTNAITHYVVSEDWNAWANSTTALITELHKYSPSVNILISGIAGSYDLSFVAQNPITNNSTVYAVKTYPASSQYLGWENAYGNIKKTNPVFVTQLGFTMSGDLSEDNYINGVLFRNDIMNYLENRHISWIACCFSSTESPALLSNKRYLPTIPGQFFKIQLQK